MHRQPVHRIWSVAKDVLGFAPGRLVAALSGFLGALLFTRLLTTEEYGRYAVLNNVAILLSSIAYGWISEAVLRFYGRSLRLGTVRDFVQTVYLLLVLMVAFVMGMGFLAVTLLRNFPSLQLPSTLIMVTAVLVMAHGTYQVMICFPQAKLKTLRWTLLVALNNVGGLLIGGLMCLFLRTAAAPLAGVIMAGLLVTALETTEARRYLGRRGGHFSRDLAAGAVSYGFPLIGSTLAAWAIASAGLPLTGVLLDAQSAGVYGAVHSLFGSGLGILVRIVMLRAYPLVVNYWEDADRFRAETTAGRFLAIYVAIVSPILAIGVLHRTDVVRILFPAPYAGADVLVAWIALGAVLRGASEFLRIPLLLRQQTARLLLLQGLAGTGNVILCLLLIPRIGILGGAYATSISSGVNMLMLLVATSSGWAWRLPARKALATAVGVISIALVYLCAVRYVPFQSDGLFHVLITVGVEILVYGILVLYLGTRLSPLTSRA